MPKTNWAYAAVLHDLETLATGVARVQGPTGGLRVRVNDESTPEETSGTAMCFSNHEQLNSTRQTQRHDEPKPIVWLSIQRLPNENPT